MDFVIGLSISINWKKDSYNFILVIVDWFKKMVYYKPVIITINAPGLAKIIIDVLVWHHGLLNSIMTDKSLLFISKFWLLVCYFLHIKCWLFIAFYLQIDGQIKRQNITIKAYLRAFINFDQNNWARLLPMAEFAYNNVKNASNGHTTFELNCEYHLCVFYKEDINPRFKFKPVDEFFVELQKLMTICQENFYHAQELQKEAHDHGVKPRSYASNDKVWLNSKYIKTK